MKRLVTMASVSLTLIWLTAGVALAEEWKGTSEVKRSSSYEVELITPAEGARVGESNLAAQIKDIATGQPVVRDYVRVDILMDEADTSMGHGNMAQQEPVAVQLVAVAGAPGRYSGRAEFSDAGAWKVRVFTDERGIQAPVTFNLSVSGGGPNWLVIGGVLALVTVAVGAVVIARRKPATAAPASPAMEAIEA